MNNYCRKIAVNQIVLQLTCLWFKMIMLFYLMILIIRCCLGGTVMQSWSSLLVLHLWAKFMPIWLKESDVFTTYGTLYKAMCADFFQLAKFAICCGVIDSPLSVVKLFTAEKKVTKRKADE